VIGASARRHHWPVRYDEVAEVWRDGERRLAGSTPEVRPALERAVEEIVDELRRRLGSPFTTRELAELYGERGTDWCFDIAARVAPDTPSAWDVATVAGTAFARYAREAVDYRTPGRRPPGLEPD
jgi:hypothetical protein